MGILRTETKDAPARCTPHNVPFGGRRFAPAAFTVMCDDDET